jgi:malonyl-CoA/methylmalonyl-CoA synthetase
MAGACVEFKSGGFDPQWTWERWRQGGLTFFSGVPTVFLRMMRFYQHTLVKLQAADRIAYDNAASQFRAMICGTSALPRPVQDFWTNLRKGKPILTRYGSTEVGAVLKVPIEGTVPDGSVGGVVAGVTLKLSEGDEGEILVKSPHLFAK